MRSTVTCLIAAFGMMLTAGCGGGGGGGGASSQSNPTQAVVAYSINNSSSTPLVGVQFSAIVPIGTDVPVDAGTHTISAQNIAAGAALSGLNMKVFGTYSAPIRKVKLGVMPLDGTAFTSGFKGEVISLTCSLTQSPKVAATDFSTVVSELFGYGYDQTAHKTIRLNALTSSVAPTLK